MRRCRTEYKKTEYFWRQRNGDRKGQIIRREGILTTVLERTVEEERRSGRNILNILKAMDDVNSGGYK